MNKSDLSIASFQLIDSHAHLDFDRFDTDRRQVLERAHAAGVGMIISIGTTVSSSKAAYRLACMHSSIVSSAGIHPHNVDAFSDGQWSELEELWAQDRVVGVGETGLDYYYDHADRQRQRDIFIRHLNVSQRLNIPVIVHIRDAFDDALAIMREVGVAAGGVVHCFTGGIEECERALDLGLHISISGIVTFKNAKSLHAAVRIIPDDRLLIETDAPFLAPVPHRGKRNEPAYVIETAKTVAYLRDQDLAVVVERTRHNAISLFELPWHTSSA